MCLEIGMKEAEVMSRGAIFSLGGTPAPIIETLKRRPVECALFVVSDKSEPQVEQAVLPVIGYQLQWECVRMDDPDDLNACYQQIRHALSGWNAAGCRPNKSISISPGAQSR
jgi:hypothetical protein